MKLSTQRQWLPFMCPHKERRAAQLLGACHWESAQPSCLEALVYRLQYGFGEAKRFSKISRAHLLLLLPRPGDSRGLNVGGASPTLTRMPNPVPTSARHVGNASRLAHLSAPVTCVLLSAFTGYGDSPTYLRLWRAVETRHGARPPAPMSLPR